LGHKAAEKDQKKEKTHNLKKGGDQANRNELKSSEKESLPKKGKGKVDGDQGQGERGTIFKESNRPPTLDHLVEKEYQGYRGTERCTTWTKKKPRSFPCAQPRGKMGRRKPREVESTMRLVGDTLRGDRKGCVEGRLRPWTHIGAKGGQKI